MVTLIAAGSVPRQALPEPLSAGVAAVPSLCCSGSRPASSLSSKICNFLCLKPVGLEGVFVATLFAVIFLSQLNSPVRAHPTLCQHLVVSQLRAGSRSFPLEWKQQIEKWECVSASPALVKPWRAGTTLKGLWAPKGSLHDAEILGLTVSIWGSLEWRNKRARQKSGPEHEPTAVSQLLRTKLMARCPLGTLWLPALPEHPSITLHRRCRNTPMAILPHGKTPALLLPPVTVLVRLGSPPQRRQSEQRDGLEMHI